MTGLPALFSPLIFQLQFHSYNSILALTNEGNPVLCCKRKSGCKRRMEIIKKLIGDKWKVLILRDLMPGTKRFGELKKSIGNVSQKVLTAQLRAMEENGLVNRKVYAEVPPRVEYSLTQLGRSLKPILDAMQCWGEEYKVQNSRND